MAESINIFDTVPSFEEWCEANKLNPTNEDNYSNYLEWKANS